MQVAHSWMQILFFFFNQAKLGDNPNFAVECENCYAYDLHSNSGFIILTFFCGQMFIYLIVYDKDVYIFWLEPCWLSFIGEQASFSPGHLFSGVTKLM